MNYEAEGTSRPTNRAPPPVVCSDLSSSSSSDLPVLMERQMRSNTAGKIFPSHVRPSKHTQAHCLHSRHMTQPHLKSHPQSVTAAAAAAESPSAAPPRRRRVRHGHAHSHGALLLRPGCSSTSHRVRLHAHHTHYASCRGVSSSAVCCDDAPCCHEGTRGTSGATPAAAGSAPATGSGAGGIGATTAASSSEGETQRSVLLRARRHRHHRTSRSTHRARSVGVPCSRVRTSRFCVQLAPCAAAAAAVAAAASAKYSTHHAARKEAKTRGRVLCSRCCGNVCPEEVMYCPLLCTSSESATTTPRTPRYSVGLRRRVTRLPTQLAQQPSSAAATTRTAAFAVGQCCAPPRTRHHRPSTAPQSQPPSSPVVISEAHTRRRLLSGVRTREPVTAAAAEISSVTTDVDALLAEYERAYAARTRSFLSSKTPPAPLPPPAPSPPLPQQRPWRPRSPSPQPRLPPAAPAALAPLLSQPPPPQQQHHLQQQQQQPPPMQTPQSLRMQPSPTVHTVMAESFAQPFTQPLRPQGSDAILSGLLSELMQQGFSVNINATEGPVDRLAPQPSAAPRPISARSDPPTTKGSCEQEGPHKSLSPSLARMMAPRRDSVMTANFSRPTSAAQGHEEVVPHSGERGESDVGRPGAGDERTFTPLTPLTPHSQPLATPSPPPSQVVSLSSRGTAIESALQASATLMDLCAGGARLLAPRRRTKGSRSAPVPSCGCAIAAAGSGEGEHSRAESGRHDTPLRCLFERVKARGDSPDGLAIRRRRRRRSSRRRSNRCAANKCGTEDDAWLLDGCDISADSSSSSCQRVTPPTEDHITSSPAPAHRYKERNCAKKKDELAELSAEMELRASKSYIVQLIDRALSREMGESRGGSGGGGGGGGSGGVGGGGGIGVGVVGGGSGDGFKGGEDTARHHFHQQQGCTSKPGLQDKEEVMSTRGDPVTISTSAEHSSVDCASIDRLPTFTSQQQKQQQHEMEQHNRQKQEELHPQQSLKQSLIHQQQLLLEQMQQNKQQAIAYPPVMQVVQASPEGLGKANYLLVPLSETSTPLWQTNRIAEEPPYMRQLRQLRWDHLKHIQREIQRLEEIERVQNGWPTDGKPTSL